MPSYRPGTLDDLAVLRRRRRAERAVADGAAMPTGSQLNQTSAKVGSGAWPVGSLVWMAEESPPELPGAWELWCAHRLPMTGLTAYIYVRKG